MDRENHIERKTSAQLAGLMARSLVDEMMMARYGTSLEIGMTREYQKYLDEKYHKLKSEFDQINRDADAVLSFEELVEFFQGYTKEVGYINFNYFFRLEKYTIKPI
jgi:hypothetical protein